jgi:superfamily II DNA or RNA helicase
MHSIAETGIVTEETQIARRRQRAKQDIESVTNTGPHPLFSTYEVVARSGRCYTVHIRSAEQLINSCTCPDYKTNTLGTCKHIEGVLLHLRKTLGRKWNKLAAEALPGTQIFLHRSEQVSVRVTLPLPAGPLYLLLNRYFDSQGILQGSVRQSLAALIQGINSLSTELHDRLFIHSDVLNYLEALQHLDSVKRQKEWFLEQTRQGNRSLKVLKSDLYPFQKDGVLHLAFNGRGLLADDMGLGKTVQAIGAVSLLHQLRDIKRVLVVCPASLKHQWEREIHRFTNFTTCVISGSLETRKQLYRKPAFFNIINYELVRRDTDEMHVLHPDVIILDEAQRIKNWRTKTADAVKQLRSRYAFVLTGTPLENRLDELYSVFQFIDPGVLGPMWRFNQRYFQLEKRKSGSYKVLGYRNLDELRKRISPYVFRRTRDEVLEDLPPRTDNNYFVEITPGQRKAYNGFRDTMARLLTIMRKRPLSPKEHDILLRSMMKMRMICNALALHDKELSPDEAEKTSPKLRELGLILEDEVISAGRKAIVFSQWTGMLDLAKHITDRLGIGSVTLSGKVPTARRGALIASFFEDPNCRVFFSSDAGGVGLNLQAASLVINLDLPWNPAVLEQRIARAHRHGQKNAVQVVNLIAKGTIEERMLDTLASKREVFQGVFGTDEDLTEISFVDSGQQIMKQIQELIMPEPVEAKLDLAPSAEVEPETVEKPELSGYADMLLGAFPGRILLVRYAPDIPGVHQIKQILVVVDQNPDTIRPAAENMIAEHFSTLPSVPGLHVLDQHGYRTLTTLLGTGMPETAELMNNPECYCAPSLVTPGLDEQHSRQLKLIEKGFSQAARRLQLATTVVNGGFPEEALRPVREALAWALSSILAQTGDEEPSDKLPSPRLLQAKLVETDRLSTAQAGEVARVRELTAPPDSSDDTVSALSEKTAEDMILSVEKLIDHGRELSVLAAV